MRNLLVIFLNFCFSFLPQSNNSEINNTPVTGSTQSNYVPAFYNNETLLLDGANYLNAPDIFIHNTFSATTSENIEMSTAIMKAEANVYAENGIENFPAPAPDAAPDANEIDEESNALRFENSIFYDYNKSVMRPEANVVLDSAVFLLNRFPDLFIELEGHTDSRGKAKYNHALSLKRTASASTYLIKQGIAADRIRQIGKGESTLVNDCTESIYCNETGHQFNRRTIVRLGKAKL